MSEATIFEFPYNLFLMQRLEFTVICMDELEAKIMRVIEVEMALAKAQWQKRVEVATEAKKPAPREPREYWVRLSQSQIIARLYMYDSAKLKKPENEDMESEEWKKYFAMKALSISKSTLTKKINSLIEKGFLLMRSKQGDEFGAPIYTLHHVNVQKAVKALPTDAFSIFHMGGVSNIESGGESQNLRVPVSNSQTPTPNFSESQSQKLGVDIDIDIDSSEDTYKEESIVVSAVAENDAPAPIDFTEQKKKRDTEPRIPALKIGDEHAHTSRIRDDMQDTTGRDGSAGDSHSGNPTHSRQGQVALQVSSSHSQRLSEDDEFGDDFDPDAHEREVIEAFMGNDNDVPTVKLAAVKIGGNNDTIRTTRSDTSMAHDNPQGTPGNTVRTTHTEFTPLRGHEIVLQQTPGTGTRSRPADPPVGIQESTSVQAPTLPGTGVTPARRSGVATSPPASTDAAQGGKKVTQAKLKSPEELEQDERCRALQERINEWRGYPLEVKGQIINERKSIRTLVERYSDEQIEQFYLYLFNRHWKWSKPDNRYHIGAYVILSEAQSIEQELKAKPAKELKPTGTDPYTQASLDPERNRRNIERLKQKAALHGHTF